MGEEQSHELPEKETMSDAMAAGEETTKNDNDDDAIIVLKVYMHCEACARKVARSLKGFPGVEDVMADSYEGIVRVKGKSADPVEVQGRVQEKSRRNVELISPLPKPLPPPPPLNDGKTEENNKPPAPITILLSVQMHCEACARVIRKKLQKIKGVQSARTDLSNNQVTVTGIVDPTELLEQVYKRTKKKATIVPSPSPSPSPSPPMLEESDHKVGGEEVNRDGKNGDMSNGGESKDNKEEDMKQEDVKRNQIWPTRHSPDHYQRHYAYAYPPPPQVFSDENPNACFIM